MKNPPLGSNVVVLRPRGSRRGRPRTPDWQPTNLIGPMYENTGPDGRRYFVGFVGGNKLLLFPTNETSQAGLPRWLLHSQGLHPAEQLKPGDPSRVVPGRVAAFPPDEPAAFVSGLPSKDGGAQ